MYAKRDEGYYAVIRNGRLVVEEIAYNEDTADNFEQLIAERKAEYGRMNGNKQKDTEKAHGGENSSHEEQNSEDQNSDVIDFIVVIHFQ